MKMSFIKSLFIMVLVISFTIPTKIVMALPIWVAPVALEVIKEFVIDTAIDVVQEMFKDSVKPEQVVELEKRVTDLEGQLTNYLKTSNAPPTQEFNDLKKMVEKLGSLINALNARLSAVEGKMDSLESRMAKMEMTLADLGEVRKLLLNIPQKLTAGKLSPVDFKFSAIYRTQGKGNFKELTEGSVLKSGDHYKFIFTPAEECYVYVFQMDSSNSLFQLFPLQEFGGVKLTHENPVKAGKTYFIPADDKSFFLDNKTGTETIYFLVTRQQDVVIEQEYQALQLAQQRNQVAAAQQMQIALVRATKGIRERKGAGGVAGDVSTEIVLDGKERFSVLYKALNDMCNGCVSTLTFKHE